MHLTPSWVHVRFTDPYSLFATDSDEHYDSLCDMGSMSQLGEVRMSLQMDTMSSFVQSLVHAHCNISFQS